MIPSKQIENVGNKSLKALQRTQDKLEYLSSTVELAEEKLYKELCQELSKGEDLPYPQETYEDLYVDIIHRWTEEIRSIQVNIVQLTNWIDNEASHDFSDLHSKIYKTRREGLEEQHKNQFYDRIFSARTQKSKFFHESLPQRGHQTDILSTRDAYSRQEPRDHLTVKLNRTMKLRKAENQRRQKATEGDPFNVPAKRVKKKLDEYKLRYVYDRLHDTPTFASTLQRKKGRKSARGLGLFQQHSITTVKTLPLSRTQTPVKVNNGRYGSGRPERCTGNANSITKHCSLPPIHKKVSLVAQGGAQTKLDIDKTTLPSRLPRPCPTKRSVKISKEADETVLDKKENNQEGLTDREMRSDVIPIATLEEQVPKSPDSSEGKQKSGHFHWKKLLKSFPPRRDVQQEAIPKLDDFSDKKSSFMDAQKIYGLPKRKTKAKKKTKQAKKDEKIGNTSIVEEGQVPKKDKRIKQKKIQQELNEEFDLQKPKPRNDESPREYSVGASNATSETFDEAPTNVLTKTPKKKPKSAVIKSLATQWAENATLIEEVDTSDSTSTKVKQRKSKSDNNLDTTTKDVVEVKTKKKPKQDTKQAVQQSTNKAAAESSNTNDQQKTNSKGPPTQIPRKQVRRKQVKKDSSPKQSQGKIQIKKDSQAYKTTRDNSNCSTPQDNRKSRNKPRSTIVRNALAESEELNLGPSADYIFTKFSDQPGEKAKLAKLDEKFRHQKERVEKAVIRNQRDCSLDDSQNVQYLVDLSDSDVSLAKEESSGSVLPTDFDGTSLLRRRIDQLKEDLIRKTLESSELLSDPQHPSPPGQGHIGRGQDSEFWDMSQRPRVFQNRPILHHRA